MRRFESYLICLAFIIAGSFIGNLITKPSIANAVEVQNSPTFTPNQLELPLNIDISRTGKVDVSNALNRTVSVNNALPKVVIKWRTKYRYFPVYKIKWKTVSRNTIHRYDSIAKNKNLDTLDNIDSLI